MSTNEEQKNHELLHRMYACVQYTQLQTQAQIKALDGTPESITQKLGGPGLSLQEYTTILNNVLTVFRSKWEISVNQFFHDFHKSFRDMLITEVQLIVVFLNTNPTTLSIASYPKFPTILKHMFPIETPVVDEDQRLLLQVQTETSWSLPPLQLWWVGVENSSEYGWFVVANTQVNAINFFRMALKQGNIPPIEENTLYCEHIGAVNPAVSMQVHNNSVSWTSMEALWSVGCEIVVPMFPRVVKVNNKLYKEGTMPIGNRVLTNSADSIKVVSSISPKKHLLN